MRGIADDARPAGQRPTGWTHEGGWKVTPARRLAFFVGSDTLLTTLCLLAALGLRFEGDVPGSVWASAPLPLAVAVLSTIVGLALTRTYNAAWGYFGLRDVARVALAVAGATVVFGGFLQYQYVSSVAQVPRSIALLQAPLTFCALSGFHLAKRAARLYFGPGTGPGTPTLLIGAGDAGVQVLMSILEPRGTPTHSVVGFLDDDPLARGQRIHGVPVLGPTQELENAVRHTGAKCIIVCTAATSGPFVAQITDRARAAGIATVRIVPRVHEILDGKVTIDTTREVSLEDLLGREKVEIDAREIGILLKGRGILVTGGAGTIGSELCRQIARREPASLTILDVDETRLHDLALELREAHPRLKVSEALVDVRNLDDLRATFESGRPHIVFHAAAFKHVPMMERFPLSALDVNVLGTMNTAGMAEAFGTERFVLVSTDKAVEPSSVMGASKRLAELVLFSDVSRTTQKRMIRSAVRFGNVIGSRGSVIPTFERQLKRGGPLTVTHPDMERFFMMTSEAVSLVLQAAALGEGNDIFVLDMGKPVRIDDMARAFVRLQGLEPGKDINIVYTGLRPGEKLAEILHYPHEVLSVTRHDRVMRAAPLRDAASEGAEEIVRGLVADRDMAAARQYLAKLFPTLELAGGTRTTKQV